MALGEGPDDVAHDVAKDLRLEVDPLLAAGSGQEQEVLDEAEEALGVGGDVGDHLGMALRAPIAVLEQPGIPEDRRDRGA